MDPSSSSRRRRRRRVVVSEKNFLIPVLLLLFSIRCVQKLFILSTPSLGSHSSRGFFSSGAYSLSYSVPPPSSPDSLGGSFGVVVVLLLSTFTLLHKSFVFLGKVFRKRLFEK